MELIILGSGTAAADPSRGAPGFVLTHAGSAWLVDGGSGTLQRCARAGIDPAKLDGGLYTHHHPDHCADLAPLLFSMRLGPRPRTRDYPVYAGEGFARILTGLQTTWGHWVQPGEGTVLLHELPLDRPCTRTVGPFLLTTAPSDHGAGALHLRLDAGGRSVVFSGDTGPESTLAELAAGADLLVCECGGSDEDPLPGHLTPSGVASIAARARPAEIWLTHLYPQVDPVRALRTVRSVIPDVRIPSDGDRWPLRRA